MGSKGNGVLPGENHFAKGGHLPGGGRQPSSVPDSPSIETAFGTAASPRFMACDVCLSIRGAFGITGATPAGPSAGVQASFWPVNTRMIRFRLAKGDHAIPNPYFSATTGGTGGAPFHSLQQKARTNGPGLFHVTVIYISGGRYSWCAGSGAPYARRTHRQRTPCTRSR